MQTLKKLYYFKTLCKYDNYIVFFIAFIFFTNLIPRVSSDIIFHIEIARKVSAGNEAVGNFLFYFLVNVFSFFSQDLYALIPIANLILSFSVFFKYFLTKKFIKSFKSNKSNDQIWIISLSLFSLLFMPIVNGSIFSEYSSIYLGNLVGNIYHNSTTILLLPFSFLLFWKQSLLFENKEYVNKKNILIILSLILLNVVIKPSYILVFIPATLFMSIWVYKKTFKTVQCLLPAVFAAVVVFLQKLLIYDAKLDGALTLQNNQIQISKPLEIWSHFFTGNQTVVSTVFLSFAFPIIMLLVNNTFRRKYSRLILYILVQVIFAILIYSFFLESGSRRFHGNFYWQIVPTTYHLIVISLISFWDYWTVNKNKFLKGLILFLLGAHVISGILYIIRMFVFKSFKV